MVDINPKPNLSIIVAVAQNNAIGKNNDLIWHISDDLRRFKALTSGHAVVMGRKTYDSIPKKPLPKRRNIVLTHDPDFHSDGVEVAHTIAELLRMVAGEEETFIMGGANLYQQMMPFVQRLYVTWVYKDFDADAYFPTIDASVFHLTTLTEQQQDPESGLLYAYAEYNKIGK